MIGGVTYTVAIRRALIVAASAFLAGVLAGIVGHWLGAVTSAALFVAYSAAAIHVWRRMQ